MSEHIGELISFYMDEEVNEAERNTIEKHLAICPECSDKLLELTILREQIHKEYQRIEIPDMIEDFVIAKIQQASTQNYSAMLNRMGLFALVIFAFIFLAMTSPFLSIGYHILNTVFSIANGLIHAIPPLISANPYVLESVSGFILVLIALAILTIRYLVHTMGNTVKAEDI